ncbi:MAG: TolC family protein, partial [Polyangiales bacterium]
MIGSAHRIMRFTLDLLFVVVAATSIVACKSMPEWKPQRFVSGGPASPWTPDPQREWFAAAEGSPEEILLDAPTGVLSLAELVDLGLRNNPRTTLAWEQARAAAAGYGEARAALYPSLDVGGGTAVSNTNDPNDFL